MSRQKGFTLVEAAVAIGVVFLLSGILVPIVLRNIEDARVAKAHNDIDVIAGAIAMQMRTFGRRPTLAALAGGPDATGNAIWFSGGADPNVVGGANPLAAAHVQQTFANLFNAPPATGQAIFGTPAAGPFSYQGPYLPVGAPITDPWGRAYLILGYNANGQASNSPIWVVSAGPEGTIASNNIRPLTPPAVPVARYRNLWGFAAASRRNIAVRVN